MRVSPWHSILSSVHHNNMLCTQATTSTARTGGPARAVSRCVPTCDLLKTAPMLAGH
jgi:hypothetical protein